MEFTSEDDTPTAEHLIDAFDVNIAEISGKSIDLDGIQCVLHTTPSLVAVEDCVPAGFVGMALPEINDARIDDSIKESSAVATVVVASSTSQKRRISNVALTSDNDDCGITDDSLSSTSVGCDLQTSLPLTSNPVVAPTSVHAAVAVANVSEPAAKNHAAHDDSDDDDGADQKLSAASIFREEFADFDMHVSFCSTAGNRAHMEDVCVHAHNYFNHCPQSVENRRPYHYFGVFDGHGGRQASEFVSNHLLDFITQQPGFWQYDDDRAVMQAIYDGFLHCHVVMWKHALPTWPLLPNGHRSTAGTTASVGILRDRKLYIGHVGDSGIVLVERVQKNDKKDDADACFQKHRKLSASASTLFRNENGKDDEDEPMELDEEDDVIEKSGDAAASSGEQNSLLLCAQRLTDDHKPEAPDELERIHIAGGAVRCKQGVHRVVWRRPLMVPVIPAGAPGSALPAGAAVHGSLRRNLSALVDEHNHHRQLQQPAMCLKYSIIPFLAVARSLGDFWSFNADTNDFIVSPAPDVSCINLEWPRHRGLVIGSDGLWNFCKPEEAVELVEEVDRLREMWFWQMSMAKQSSSLRRRRHKKKSHRTHARPQRSASQAGLSTADNHQQREYQQQNSNSGHQRSSSFLSSSFGSASRTDSAGVVGGGRSRHSTGRSNSTTTTATSLNTSSVNTSATSSTCGDMTDDDEKNEDITDNADGEADDDAGDATDSTTTTDAESLASIDFEHLQHDANEVNVAECIIHKVVGRCSARHLRADNIAVFVVLFEPKAAAAAGSNTSICRSNSMATTASSSSSSVVKLSERSSSIIMRSVSPDGLLMLKSTPSDAALKSGRLDVAAELKNKNNKLDTSTLFSTGGMSSSSSMGSATIGGNAIVTENNGAEFKVIEKSKSVEERCGLHVMGQRTLHRRKRFVKVNDEKVDDEPPRPHLNGTLFLMKQHLRKSHQQIKLSTSLTSSSDGATPSINEQEELPPNISAAAVSEMLSDFDGTEPFEVDLPMINIPKQQEDDDGASNDTMVAAAAPDGNNNIHPQQPQAVRSSNHQRHSLASFLASPSSQQPQATLDSNSIFLTSPFDAVVNYESTLERLHSLLRPPLTTNIATEEHATAVRQQFLANAVTNESGIQFYLTPADAGNNPAKVLEQNVQVRNETTDKTSLKLAFEADVKKITPEAMSQALELEEAMTKNGISSPKFSRRHRRRHLLTTNGDVVAGRADWHWQRRLYRKLHIHNAHMFGPKQVVTRLLGQVQAGFTPQHKALFLTPPVAAAAEDGKSNEGAASTSNPQPTAAATKARANGVIKTVAKKRPSADKAQAMSDIATTSCRVMGVKSLKKNSIMPFNIPTSRTNGATPQVPLAPSTFFPTNGTKFNFIIHQPPLLPVPHAVISQQPPAAPTAPLPLPLPPSRHHHHHHHHHHQHGHHNNGWLSSAHAPHQRAPLSFLSSLGSSARSGRGVGGLPRHEQHQNSTTNGSRNVVQTHLSSLHSAVLRRLGGSSAGGSGAGSDGAGSSSNRGRIV